VIWQDQGSYNIYKSLAR